MHAGRMRGAAGGFVSLSGSSPVLRLLVCSGAFQAVLWEVTGSRGP